MNNFFCLSLTAVITGGGRGGLDKSDGVKSDGPISGINLLNVMMFT